jgi:hypothetical protein
MIKFFFAFFLAKGDMAKLLLLLLLLLLFSLSFFQT